MSIVRSRDGGNKIVLAAKALVILVQAFAAYLKIKYPPPSPISSLIDAILALAPLIPSAEAQVFEYSGMNEAAESDPSTIPGIDPSAPPPVPPV